jgi:hypothetical protein
MRRKSLLIRKTLPKRKKRSQLLKKMRHTHQFMRSLFLRKRKRSQSRSRRKNQLIQDLGLLKI